MWFNEEQCRRDIVEVGKMLYDRKLLIATDGNMSVRTSKNELLITSSGFCKGKLTVDQITKVDMEGNVLSGLKPARDIRMHLATYQARPNAKAVVHAHPPIATGFAIAGIEFNKVTLPEILFSIGSVGVTEYATPTTGEVPKSVLKKLNEDPKCEALILSNHGALTFGNDIMEAFYKMETLEMFLTATLVSKILGKENSLTDQQVQKVWMLKNGETAVPTIPSEASINSSELKMLISSIVEEVLKKMS